MGAHAKNERAKTLIKMNNDAEDAITAYIGLGSNLGSRAENLDQAIARMEGIGIKITGRSSIYETEPVGLSDQPWFLNQVIEAQVSPEVISESGHPETIAAVQASAFLSKLLRIENEMGRERTIVNGPRVIDIDLLLLGDLITAHSNEDIKPGDLLIPHPRMHLRRFVLEPLCEIAPELIHPGLRKTCSEMLASLDDASIVRRYYPGLGHS